MGMKINTKNDLRLQYRLQTGKSDIDNHGIEYLQWLEDRLLKKCSTTNIAGQRELLIDFARSFKYRGKGFLDCQIESVVNSYLKGN